MKVIFALSIFLLSGAAMVNSQVHFGPPRQHQSPIQRRQLTNLQQNHILSDIQKHQHRFNVHQQQPRQPFNQFQQQQQQQPQQPFAFPQQQQQPLQQQARFQQQLPLQQSPPAFRQPSVIPAPQNVRQTQFQRSVHNQVGQFAFNPQIAQPQFVQQPVFQDPATNFAPIAAPLVQQPPVRPPQNFFPNNPVQFPQQQQQQQQPQQQQIQQPRLQIPFQQQQQTPFQQQQQIQQPRAQQPPQFIPQQSFQNPFLQPTQSLPLEQRANVFLDPRTDDQRQKEEIARQKLIEKHEKFAQKYYQNQQALVQRQHEEFLKKQRKIQDETQDKLRTQQSQIVAQKTPSRHQGVKPTDLSAFEKSVQNFYKVNPTSPAPTQPTTVVTTPNPLTVVPLKKTSPKSKPEIKTLNSLDIKALLQGNSQSLLSQLKQEAKSLPKTKSKSPLSRDDLLKQLKQALAEETPDLGGQNFTAQDIVLPNGEKVQVIRTSDPDLIRQAKAGQLVEPLSVAGTTAAPLSIADLAKSGFLPPGTDFEVIKQSENGLQQVEKVPSQKKVTFVYLEEQDDGSYKVQGVKGNADKEVKTQGTEVDTILQRIKNGEIKLPPAAKTSVKPIDIPTPPPSTTVTQTTRTASPSTTLARNQRPIVNSISPASTKAATTRFSASTIAPQTITPVRQSTARGSTVFHYSFSATTPKPTEDNGRSPYSTLPTFTPTEQRGNFFSVTPRVTRLSQSDVHEIATASSVNHFRSAEAQKLVSPTRGIVSSASTPSPAFSTPVRSSISYSPTFTTTPPTTTASSSLDMVDILKNTGLFAMAKYLKQSGLDSILNETGPYTVFAPTDKAFKNLLIQLGGPEKAEEKFRNNPRLLSGLLLHHVIPGSFKIDELQDEMTGVSLAGTQLRVNQYQMQDVEWNDIKVTTINGATVLNDNNDIIIPQGVAHGIDRVMFPLPVGDILQTLQSDRERRFTNFLRAVFASNMADTLQNKGIKTYTIFAPTDFAFSHLTSEELNTLVSDKDSAQQLVERHVVPGTLFTSGMRFYQVKDTLAEDKSLTVQKSGGKVKVNESTILTSNIPATNGVIHAIDHLL